MNISTYHPLQSFDLLAIGIALVVVIAIVGFRVMTGRPAGPFNRPPLPEDESLFPPTRTARPRTATPALPPMRATVSSDAPDVITTQDQDPKP